MNRTIVVTACDTAYLVHLFGLLGSLAGIRHEVGFDVGLLDVGIDFGVDAELARTLSACVKMVKLAALSPHVLEGTPLVQGAYLERAYLPDHFPGYDTIVWIDADAWVQDPGAVTGLVAAARHGSVACVPEVDRAYAWNDKHIELTNGWAYNRYRKFFGVESTPLCRYPMINDGVFAVRADSPFWRHWQSCQQVALLNNGYAEFGIDQLSFNFALYHGRHNFERLPSRVNWLCSHALPLVNRQGVLAEPCYPHEPLGIVHMVDHTKREKQTLLRIADVGTEAVDTQLNYASFAPAVERWRQMRGL